MKVMVFHQFWYKTTYTEIWQNHRKRNIVEIPAIIDKAKLRDLSIVWKTQIARKKLVRLQKAHLSQ